MLEYGPDSKSLYDSLCEEFGDKNSSVHISWIQCVEPDDKKRFPHLPIKELAKEKVKEIIATADRVLSIINENELLAFYGIKSDQRPDATKLKM